MPEQQNPDDEVTRIEWRYLEDSVTTYRRDSVLHYLSGTSDERQRA